MHSSHDIPPWVKQSGHSLLEPFAGMADPQRGRLQPKAAEGFGDDEQGFGIAGRISLSQDVIVADFLSCPSQMPVYQVQGRIGPIGDRQETLQ